MPAVTFSAARWLLFAVIAVAIIAAVVLTVHAHGGTGAADWGDTLRAHVNAADYGDVFHHAR